MASIRAALETFRTQMLSRIGDLSRELRQTSERQSRDLGDYRALTERAVSGVHRSVVDHGEAISGLERALEASTERIEAAFEGLAARVEALESAVQRVDTPAGSDAAAQEEILLKEVRALGYQLEVIRRRLPLRAARRSSATPT